MEDKEVKRPQVGPNEQKIDPFHLESKNSFIGMSTDMKYYTMTLFFKIPSQIDEQEMQSTQFFEHLLYLDFKGSFLNRVKKHQVNNISSEMILNDYDYAIYAVSFDFYEDAKEEDLFEVFKKFLQFKENLLKTDMSEYYGFL